MGFHGFWSSPWGGCTRLDLGGPAECAGPVGGKTLARSDLISFQDILYAISSILLESYILYPIRNAISEPYGYKSYHGPSCGWPDLNVARIPPARFEEVEGSKGLVGLKEPWD